MSLLYSNGFEDDPWADNALSDFEDDGDFDESELDDDFYTDLFGPFVDDDFDSFYDDYFEAAVDLEIDGPSEAHDVPGTDDDWNDDYLDWV